MKYQGIGGKYSGLLAWIFFILGIIGAVGLRFVLIIQNFNPLYAKVSWYVAMGAFLFFYLYRYIIEDKRRKIIQKNQLIEKVEQNNIGPEEKESILKILNSIMVSKSKLNFLILFILTIAAMIIQILIDIK
jgi:hypothetical protein